MLNIRWCLTAITDAILNDFTTAGAVTIRGLSGRGCPSGRGLVEMFCFKKALQVHATCNLLHVLPLPDDQKAKITHLLSSHEVYRAQCGYENVDSVKQRQWLQAYRPAVRKLIIFFGDR